MAVLWGEKSRRIHRAEARGPLGGLCDLDAI